MKSSPQTVPLLKGMPRLDAMPRRRTKSVWAMSTTSRGAKVICPRHWEISTTQDVVAWLRYQTRLSHIRLFAAAASPRSA